VIDGDVNIIGSSLLGLIFQVLKPRPQVRASHQKEYYQLQAIRYPAFQPRNELSRTIGGDRGPRDELARGGRLMKR